MTTTSSRSSIIYYCRIASRNRLLLFATVNVDKVPVKLQYDYCAAYLAMSEDDPKRARTIAAKHAAEPVDRWRIAFQSVLAQCDEIDGKPTKATDAENRLARQTEEAAKQPSFDFTLDNKAINLNWQNLEAVTVNYYLMDVELLFSRNPFVQQTGSQFALIKPNLTKEIKLPAGQAKFSVPLPEDLLKKNVLVEIVAAGKTHSLPYYANAMDVKVTDAYGQLKVTNSTTGKALAKVYVKAYVRTQDGQVKFHKDGYTDLRGRFDYASVSTPERSRAGEVFAADPQRRVRRRHPRSEPAAAVKLLHGHQLVFFRERCQHQALEVNLLRHIVRMQLQADGAFLDTSSGSGSRQSTTARAVDAPRERGSPGRGSPCRSSRAACRLSWPAPPSTGSGRCGRKDRTCPSRRGTSPGGRRRCTSCDPSRGLC